MNFKKGFSLIELLVVIAIIGILAGIIFPVFARAKDSAYRSSDMSNMNELRTALQLYRTDQGAYPPALFGYATMYDGGVNNLMVDQVIPANQVKGALFPKRIVGTEVFRPAYDRQTNGSFNQDFATTVWPAGVGTGMGAGQSNQRYGNETIPDRCADTNIDPQAATMEAIPRYFYKLSGYDYGQVKTATGTQDELRYTLFWTGWSVPADPCDPQADEQGDANDNPRQLGYTDPPDTTIVTWDTWFREYNGDGTLADGKRDIVLFLGGSARMVDSKNMATQAYSYTP